MTFIKAIPFQNIFISDPLAKLDDAKSRFIRIILPEGNWLNGGSNTQSENKVKLLY